MNNQEYIIYGLLKNPLDAPKDWSLIPAHIDYKVQVRKLHARPVIVSGELQRMDFYQSYDDDTKEFKNLVLSRFCEWIREVPGDQSTRLVKRPSYHRWMKRDGELGEPFYDEPKIYHTLHESKKADTRRRQNIVIELESRAKDFDVEDDVKVLFRSLSGEVRSYEHLYDSTLIQSILSLPYEWLDRDISVDPYISMISQAQSIPQGTKLRVLLATILDYGYKVIPKT